MKTKVPDAASPEAKTSGGRIYYARIPRNLTPEQSAVVDGGGPYPVIESDHLVEHEMFVEFLIDRSLDAWTRSQG